MLPEALSTRSWPLRRRLAAVSALLTLIILLAFAFVVGRLATDRLRDDFRSEIVSVAGELAFEVRVLGSDPLTGLPQVQVGNLDRMAMANDAAVRVVTADGLALKETPGAPDLGPPQPDRLVRTGEMEVATLPVPTNVLGGPPVFVQYARSHEELDATIGRLWLFLAGGVAGGTILAMLAGLAVAGRAMRPIAALTAAAREIATTRDPSRRIPQPESDDEVAELARTLDEMLRQLDAARSETEQVIQAQREFVADASHELRTPLTSVLANLELLQERLGPAGAGGEDAEIVDSALRSTRRMGRLVSDLLLLARADAGRTGPRRECDLAEIAAAAVSEVLPVADGHALVLDAPAPVAVRGNPDELHRLAVNLLENGVRHTPAGTEIHIGVSRDGEAAVLDVFDDGPGVPAGMEEQIFSRFVRGAGPADVAGGDGTGLGLAIVSAVAASHGGDVAAGASPLGGARFTVRLPLEPAPRPDRTPVVGS